MCVKAFLDLRDGGMVKGETDWAHQMFVAISVLPAGVEHYQRAQRYRRRFASLSGTADELTCRAYARVSFRRRRGQDTVVEVIEGRVPDYQELAQTGLLKIQWADDAPWFVATTKKGLSYVRGDFMDEERDEHQHQQQPNLRQHQRRECCQRDGQDRANRHRYDCRGVTCE